MEEVKQSLQETASKERESYKSVFLKKRSVCNRQSVYISGEIQKRIVQIVGVITNKQVSIGNFIDNVLEEHLGAHNDVLSALYREEIQKGIFNQPKENIVTIEEQTFKQVCGRFSGFVSQVERICKENTHQPEKWLSGREVCALLGISIRSLQNYRDSGKLGYSQIGNKLYYKSADIERLIAECTENKKANYKSNNK